ncbi:DUF1080 domain-containing protein [Compostibacter hankyongensis]|uniref:DUF1080 domain-containing protein n=1 Tax=Compostibacter hankyongensis TaxID=1007089 RepID=A0ABP8G4Y7_9BACT
MKRIFGVLFLLPLGTVAALAQQQEKAPQMTHEMTEFWSPVPKVVTPGQSPSDAATPAPSDAIVLFDGKDLSQWEGAPDADVLVKGKDMSKFKSSAGKTAQWTIKDGVLTVNKAAGDIQTKQTFGDFQLHIEWRIPEDIAGSSQARGNSGVFLQGRYELQILDSYHNETYVNGQAASIYKQTAPLVNAMRKPGDWNVYDILYTAPTFKEDGTYRTKPMVTVLQNGVLVQYNTVIQGTTPFIGLPQVAPQGNGPIRLQAHGDKSKPISFRNIWIRTL